MEIEKYFHTHENDSYFQQKCSMEAESPRREGLEKDALTES